MIKFLLGVAIALAMLFSGQSFADRLIPDGGSVKIEGLKDCKVYVIPGNTIEDGWSYQPRMYVIRCPNSQTSTVYPYGKGNKQGATTSEEQTNKMSPEAAAAFEAFKSKMTEQLEQTGRQFLKDYLNK